MTPIDALFIAFVLTQLGDYWTTYVIIVNQGGRERENELGITWRLMTWLGTVPGLVVAKAIAAAGGAWIYFVEHSLVLLGVLTAIYAWQCYENARRIRQ